MAPPPSPAPRKPRSAAAFGFEKNLWAAAGKLRGSMDPAGYKHVVLGLLFLKYISDAADACRAELRRDAADPEDRAAYAARKVFWVPASARWSRLREAAGQPHLGALIDAAMGDIERENPSLRGALPGDHARPALDPRRLGELLVLLDGVGLLDDQHRSRDVLGRVYEYFLARFASVEGRLGGEFYTPQSLVRLLVEMLEPTTGRILDPCCGSGGMFVQSERFIEAHGGKVDDVSIHGQECNPTTWRLARMNLAIRGIEADLGPRWADSLRDDQHRGLQADFILANPPFNVADWGGESLRGDPRFCHGAPPPGNANFAWLQHVLAHLAPAGRAAVVLANGSMSAQKSGEGAIRRSMVEADVVEAMVALPDLLFYATKIPVCLWILARRKARPGRVLFVDARALGARVDRAHRELTDDDIARITRAYHAWRGQPGAGPHQPIAGFCNDASLEQIAASDFVLTPGRYTGAAQGDPEPEPFDAKMKRLTATLRRQFAESTKLQREISKTLKTLGYG